jgi:hydrogenase-4 component F
MLVIALLAVPVVTGVACRLLWKRQGLIEALNVVGALLTLALGASVVVEVARDGAFGAARETLHVDALSAVMVGSIVVVGAAGALVSINYMRHDLAARHVPEGRRGLGWYYLGLHAFVFTMLATVLVDNLGLLWVGVEATTLASALLVGFYRTKAAIEAAWKYVILCTVGITFALFGVLLTYYASVQSGGGRGLDWSELSLRAGQLDGDMMRLAFVFILIGFGTKAGFAPLHTWLADAHSQAPSPVSGMLSGVLLACALYAILRFHTLTTAATGSDFSGNLLLAFGVLSVAVATPFVIVQRDLKRLLAYSSVEHIGLMAVAFGIGGAVGVYAGVLHLVNHAATKSLLFFTAGDIVQRFGTRRISAIHGALRAAPFTGWLLLLGVFAITGGPPSGIFISEVAIAGAGFGGDRWRIAAIVVVVLLLGAIFAGILAQTLRLAYGPAPAAVTSDPGTGHRWWSDGPRLAALVPLAAVIVLFGIYVPGPVSDLLNDVGSLVAPPSGTASRP